ncbi:MAG: hypothetical protein GY941_15730 [Planctomycetes bacterium]|nr:hypothetical protein [Planctomycetota bacterium]
MNDLSKRFNRSEFACKCGCRQATDYKLIDVLEKCGDYFEAMDENAERVAVHINSGNRCKQYDRALKIRLASERGEVFKPSGKPSEHTNFWAADIWMEWVYPDGHRVKIHDDDIADYLEMEYVAKYGIGRYSNRTHIDCRPDGPARWDNR